MYNMYLSWNTSWVNNWDKTITDAHFPNHNYDLCTMRRYIRNILKWNKNDIKSTRVTTGDYSHTHRFRRVRLWENSLSLPLPLFPKQLFFTWTLLETITRHFIILSSRFFLPLSVAILFTSSLFIFFVHVLSFFFLSPFSSKKTSTNHLS